MTSLLLGCGAGRLSLIVSSLILGSGARGTAGGSWGLGNRVTCGGDRGGTGGDGGKGALPGAHACSVKSKKNTSGNAQMRDKALKACFPVVAPMTRVLIRYSLTWADGGDARAAEER